MILTFHHGSPLLKHNQAHRATTLKAHYDLYELYLRYEIKQGISPSLFFFLPFHCLLSESSGPWMI